MPTVHTDNHIAPERAILHCDCNGFYASVECLDHPAYWTVPMAVAGDPKDRCGIILAKNELAKKFGIVTAETVYSAMRKCPELTLVPPRHRRYSEISKQVNQIYLQYTDQVEPFSIDESFLDVTGSLSYFRASARELADRIRERVRREIGITISVGVSFNKTFAKIASDMKKPDATTEITRENYQAVLWELPIRDMLFIGKAGMTLLESHDVRTIGDFARMPRDAAVRLLGKNGDGLWNNANGLDDSPVRRFGEHEPLKSIGNGMTFRRDLACEDEIMQGVIALSDSVAVRLRECGMKARTLQVTIRDPKMKNHHPPGTAGRAHAPAQGASGHGDGDSARQVAHTAGRPVRAHPRAYGHRAKPGAGRRSSRADEPVRAGRRNEFVRRKSEVRAA